MALLEDSRFLTEKMSKDKEEFKEIGQFHSSADLNLDSFSSAVYIINILDRLQTH